MTMSVNRPVYDDSGGAGHSLDEIAVQGGPKNGNIVELGWLVSTDQNGDADPHIFVFHWKNWQGTCYNGCGWQQYSNTYYPGQNIGSLVGLFVAGGDAAWGDYQHYPWTIGWGSSYQTEGRRAKPTARLTKSGGGRKLTSPWPGLRRKAS